MEERAVPGVSRTPSPRLLAFGFAALFVSAVCDSLRGPLLPLIASERAWSHARSSGFLTAGSLASFAFGLASIRLLSRWGDRAYLTAAAAAQSASLLLLAAGKGYPVSLLSGALGGVGGGALGLASNLLVIHGSDGPGRARWLSALHLVYGSSALLPALLVARASSLGWSAGAVCLLVFLVPATLLVSARMLPSDPPRPESETAPRALFSREVLAVTSCIATYVLGEVLASMWLVTYLHGALGWGIPSASRVLGGFFAALALGRLTTAALAGPRAARVLPPLGLAAAALCLAAGLAGHPWAFAAAGFAMGPVFPLIMAAISLEYPDDFRRIVPFACALMTAGLAGGHLLLGTLGDAFSLRAAYRLPPAFLLLALALYACWRVAASSHRRKELL